MKHPVCRLLTRSWESWCEEAVCSPSSHYNLLSGGTKSDFIFMMELLARSQKRNEPRSSTGCFSISINKSILFPFLSFPLHAGARRGGSVNLLRAGEGGLKRPWRGSSEEGENHVGNLSFDRRKYMAFFSQKTAEEEACFSCSLLLQQGVSWKP